MAKDIKDAKVLEFNKKDVTLYPDNHKPGKIIQMWIFYFNLKNIYLFMFFVSNGSNKSAKLSRRPIS